MHDSRTPEKSDFRNPAMGFVRNLKSQNFLFTMFNSLLQKNLIGNVPIFFTLLWGSFVIRQPAIFGFFPTPPSIIAQKHDFYLGGFYQNWP